MMAKGERTGNDDGGWVDEIRDEQEKMRRNSRWGNLEN